MGLIYGDLFAEWEIRIARQVVSRFLVKYSWLKGLDFEDLFQECLIHWSLQRAKFQREKGALLENFYGQDLK